jgi:pimeloyl-ACP methyl ester carboxylesterase
MAEHIQGPLYWEQLGKEGRPMIFVHPNPHDLSNWLYQTAHFSFWFRCIAIDIPGYGRSPKSTEGVTVDDYADACWEAAANVSQEPAILCGQSVGSAVVQRMAYRRPEQTAAVILSGAGWRPDGSAEVAARRIPQYREHGVGFRRGHALEDYSPAFRETAMGQYFADMFAERNNRSDADSIIRGFEALARPDPPDLHAGIKAPTIIISGSLDAAHERAFALRDRIAGCELATIEGAGHSCNMEQPWEFDRHALAFLAKHGLFPGTAA